VKSDQHEVDIEMNQRSTSADLASTVIADLSAQGESPPAEHHVREIFEVMFDVSLKTEEGQPVTCQVVFLDPNHPHVHGPIARPHNRWYFTPFSEPLAFTENDLTKLAKATDPRSSAIAVFPDDNGVLRLIGLIDQGSSFVGFINHDLDTGIPAPGMFHAVVEGPGQVAAYAALRRIAELSGSTLRGRQLPVFQTGPIHETLARSIEDEALRRVLDEVEQRYGVAILPAVETWIGYWLGVVCRLLSRVRSYRHGGAILLTQGVGNGHLRIKYPLTYMRLRAAVPKFMFQNLVQDFDRRLLKQNEVEGPAGERSYPKILTLSALGVGDQIPQTQREINDALWFIANLTRVDGCVFMDPYLGVHGFGAEIRIENDPPLVYQAHDAEASSDNLEVIDPSRYGMRHRSMMRWVWTYPQSIGFVVSQDGHVRALKRHGEAVVVWDNILLQRNINPPQPAVTASIETMTYEELAERIRRDQAEHGQE
jgi:hypothetical protein